MDNLFEKIRLSWGPDTCYPKLASKWTCDCPELGQCAVTSILIKELLGGDILYNSSLNHYWNRVSGIDIDLTKTQFKNVSFFEDKIIHVSELLSNENTKFRYLLLKNRLESLTQKL